MARVGPMVSPERLWVRPQGQIALRSEGMRSPSEYSANAPRHTHARAHHPCNGSNTSYHVEPHPISDLRCTLYEQHIRHVTTVHANIQHCMATVMVRANMSCFKGFDANRRRSCTLPFPRQVPRNVLLYHFRAFGAICFPENCKVEDRGAFGSTRLTYNLPAFVFECVKIKNARMPLFFAHTKLFELHERVHRTSKLVI